jgi:hypothetical protein
MKRLAAAAILAFAVAATPAGASRSPTTAGAVHAVAAAVREEGGTVYWYGTAQVHCRRTTPNHFGCQFLKILNAEGGGQHGRATVTYSHGHYYVGEPRWETQSYPCIRC